MNKPQVQTDLIDAMMLMSSQGKSKENRRVNTGGRFPVKEDKYCPEAQSYSHVTMLESPKAFLTSSLIPYFTLPNILQS